MTGRSFFDAYEFAPQLRALGFRHITQREVDVPVNAWSPDPRLRGVGALNRRNNLQAIRPISYALLCDQLRWSKQAVDKLIAAVAQDLEDEALQAYISM